MTRLAELLIAQDIRRGEVVIVFDLKGDTDLLRRIYAEAKRAGRERKFYMFHLGHPEISARYNPIGNVSRATEVATRIAGQPPSEGQSAAFKEFVWHFVNVMARALVALGRKPGYEHFSRYAANVEPLLVDYFEHWLDREPSAEGWRAEVESMQIDKKSLNKGLQSRGLAAMRHADADGVTVDPQFGARRRVTGEVKTGHSVSRSHPPESLLSRNFVSVLGCCQTLYNATQAFASASIFIARDSNFPAALRCT